MYYICKCRWHGLFQILSHQFIFTHPADIEASEVADFPGHLSWPSGCFFFGYCAHLWDMHYICTSKWDNYFRDSATKLSMDIPQMLWKFCIFTGHLPKHHGCLFQTFQKFSSPIYLCTSGWRSRSSAFFQDVYPSTRAVFVGYSGHSLHLYYTWHIYFRYFGHSAPHLFVHIPWMLQKFHISFDI